MNDQREGPHSASDSLLLTRNVHEWWFPYAHETGFYDRFKRPGKVFLDIGAHVGTWTLRLAPFYQQVHAFEPDPRMFNALKKNLELNQIHHVILNQVAVSNKTGRAKLHLSRNPGTNSLVQYVLHYGDLDVETISLDEYTKTRSLDRVDLIKIDVEGAESLIIEGGLETFERFRPSFYIEIHNVPSFPDNVERCKKLLSFLEFEHEMNHDPQYFIRCV